MTSNELDEEWHPHGNHAVTVFLHRDQALSVEMMRTWYRSQDFPPHAHEYLTLGVVRCGVGTFRCRGANRTACAGDLVVIPPGVVHSGSIGRATNVVSYFAVHVPMELLRMCAEAHGFRGGRSPDFPDVVMRDEAIATALQRLEHAMQRARTQDQRSAMYASASPEAIDTGAADDALDVAVALLIGRHAAATPSGTATQMPRVVPWVVRVAREVMEDCYADNAQTSLRAIASRAGVTPCHLVRVFTQAVGVSPHRFLIQTRITHARRLLARGARPSFVATITGFADQSHLTTQFRRYVGTTPAAYQRSATLGPSAKLQRVKLASTT